MDFDEEKLKLLASQLEELCPAPPGADVVAWLRDVLAAATSENLSPMMATQFIEESYMRWIEETSG